jgi:hypothetical protein
LGVEGLQAACEENEELQAALEGAWRCYAARFFNMKMKG